MCTPISNNCVISLWGVLKAVDFPFLTPFSLHQTVLALDQAWVDDLAYLDDMNAVYDEWVSKTMPPGRCFSAVLSCVSPSVSLVSGKHSCESTHFPEIFRPVSGFES
eukprot:3940548-Rhodomonas_salina.5